MKKLSYLPLFAIVLAMGFYSCEKEGREGIRSHCGFEETNTPVESPEAFAEMIPASFEAMPVLGGTENESFYMENDGIPSFLDEEPLDVEALEGKKLIRCRLDGELALSPEQKAKLSAAWKDYLNCRKMAMEKIRSAHKELDRKMEAKRAELTKAFRANRLTEREFKAAMEKLRQEYKHESAKLKAVSVDIIKHCYKKYLEHVQRVLSPEQFKRFMHCHKNPLPKKDLPGEKDRTPKDSTLLPKRK